MSNSSFASLQPADIDVMWAPAMQTAEYARANAAFYERQLQEGAPVTIASLERMQALMSEVDSCQRPYRQEWDVRGGWSRYWIDQKGSVHSERECAAKQCPQINPQLLPALSGWEKDQAIAHAKLAVCLKCMPEAKRNTSWMAARSAEKRQGYCAGAARKPKTNTNKVLCAVCNKPAQLSPAGRVKAHPANN